MDLKAALEQKRIVAALAMKLKTLRSLAAKCTSSPIDGLPRANPTGASRVEADVIRIDEGERELEAAQIAWRMTATKLAFKIYRRLICVTNADLRAFKILIKRYVECLSWRQVIREVGYSVSRAFALHKVGLKMWKAGDRDDGATAAVC